MLLDSKQTKQQILSEFLNIAAFDGWNDQSLNKALKKCDIEEKFANLIFERGCLDVAEFYIECYNEKLGQELAKISDFHLQRIRDKIRNALYLRFESEIENKIALQRLVNFYLNPKNLTSCEIGIRPSMHALKACYKVADSIWFAINDQSTDFNFYTKRLTLAKIIFRSLPVFIKDESEDLVTTKKFIDLQIDKVMKFEKCKFHVKKVVNSVFLNENGAPKTPKEIIQNLPFFRLKNYKK